MNDLEKELSMLDQNFANTVGGPVPSPVSNEQLQAQAQVVTPTQTVIQHVQSVTQTAAPILNMDAAQKETDNMSTGVLEMGKKISTDPIEKLKGQLGEKKRIAIVGQPRYVKRHYSEDLGSFLCFGGECCKYEKPADVRYLFPVIEYPVVPNNPMQVIPYNLGGVCKLKLMVVGKDMYESLCDIYMANGNTFDGYDIIATCTKQEYNQFTLQATKNTLRASCADFNTVAAKWNNVADIAYTVVAKKMDREYYLTQKGIGFEAPASGQVITDLGDANPFAGM